MKNILVAIIAVLILAGCKKNVSELPAPTQTGANTFGAQVDNELWVPQGFGIAITAPILEAHYFINNDIFINARNFGSEPTETEFEIYLQHVVAPGTYWLNSNTNPYPDHTASYGYYVKRKINPINEWITDKSHTGRVDVTTIDSVNKIIAGTFEFTATDTYGQGNVITVTNGRFDVKIQ